MIIKSGSKILLEQREAKGLWGGLYVFPQFEDMDELKRSLSEQNLQISQQLIAFRHTFSHFHLDITPILVDLDLQKNAKNQPLVVQEMAEIIAFQYLQPLIIGMIYNYRAK
ncbi:A/G-specific adenine glycosylase [Actinobacillus equuli]|nr:A/G-specific adenine glycosylase [Actinobacillus equuli]